MSNVRDELDRRELARQQARDTRRRTDRILLLAVFAVGFAVYALYSGEPLFLLGTLAFGAWAVKAIREPE